MEQQGSLWEQKNYHLPLLVTFVVALSSLFIPALAQAELLLRVADVEVEVADVVEGACIQVPIKIKDKEMIGRELKNLTISFDISGDTSIIAGGISADMLITNAFTTGPMTGIRNPGQDLSNFNGSATPTCNIVLNQTDRGGEEIDFFTGEQNATWIIDNDHDGSGRKHASAINGSNLTIALPPLEEYILIGILEIPVQANPPDPTILHITATAHAMLPGGNVYTWDDTSEVPVLETQDEFQLSQAAGVVRFRAWPIFKDSFENAGSPAITHIPDQRVELGKTFNFSVDAVDPEDGDALSYWLVEGPAGMKIDIISGEIIWSPTEDQFGQHPVTIKAEDDEEESGSAFFIITATKPNVAPDLVPPGNRSIVEGAVFQTTLFGVDPNIADPLTYSLLGAPAQMSIDPQSGELSWTPGMADLGSNSVSAMVTDSGGLTDTELFDIEVIPQTVLPPPNQPPQLTVPDDLVLTFGTLLSIQVAATDPDVGDNLTFELLNSPTGMSIDPGTGDIVWIPLEVQIGAHDVAARVIDTPGAVDVGSFVVTVKDINKAPVAVDDLYTAHGTETLVIPASGVLGNDSDPNGDPMNAQLVTSPANGSLTLNPDGSFEYAPISPISNLVATAVTGDMAQLAEPVSINASSIFIDSDFTETDDREAFRALDGDLDTSWFTGAGDAVNLGSNPFFEIGFTVDVTVTEIQMFGNRESPDGFDFFSGIFQLFDENGVELFNSGDLPLATPDRDILVSVPSVEWVRRVRFTPTADESDHPGFAELKVMGSAEVRLFKHKTNIELTRFARFTTSASSVKPNGSNLHQNENAIDQQFLTNWYSEDGDPAPSFEVTFPDQGVTVREIQLFGTRFSTGNPNSSRHFLTGEFHLLDDSGAELWTSGVLTLTDIHTGFVLPVPVVDDVHTIRFGGVTWNHATQGPGISEFKVFGDGLVWPFYPGEEWAWTETSMDVDLNKPARHVVNTPLVVDLDGDGFPEVIFSAAVPHEGTSRFKAHIVVLDGRTGVEKMVQTDLALSVDGYVSMAIGDIDADGLPEIVAYAYEEPRLGPHQLIAFEHDLSFKWRSDEIGNVSWAGITIANLDGAGLPEILVGHQVLDANGTLLWSGVPIGDNQNRNIPIAADIDLDGVMEVIVRNRVYAADGTLLWSMASTSSSIWSATGNFDNDAYPEIVFTTFGGETFLYEHDGTLKWKVDYKARSGPPTVADFDGDGKPEIGQSGQLTYSVIDTDGQLIWDQPIDESSGTVGSAVFDFDGDGSSEVVLHDHTYMRVFRGTDGEELLKIFLTGPTAVEYAVVADIDADGHAELVVPTGGIGSYEETHGIRVYGGLDNDWVRTRKIWNQHAYHVTNVNSDSTIPMVEQHNWLSPGLNNYRQNAFAIDDPDRLDSFTYVAHAAGQGSNIARVSVDVLTPNTAPVFTSTPDTTATVDYEYLHGVQAMDAEFDPIVFELIDGPPGMTIDGPTGLLRWSPTTPDLGDHRITVKVSDVRGLSSLQTFALNVNDPVLVPDVIALLRAQAESDLAGAQLETGRVRNAFHISIPVGAVSEQNPVAGSVIEFGGKVDLIISIGPAAEDVDDDFDSFTENEGDCNDADDSIFPGATDTPGNDIDEDCDGVDASRPPAEILVLPGTATILTDEPVSLKAIGIFDDDTSQNITAIATWSTGPEFSSPTPGTFPVEASCAGVMGSASIDVVARVAGDTVAPVAEITAPVNGSTVTEPVDIIGTATDANFLKYTLGIALAGETGFTEIASSTTPVSDDVLGQFDPSMLINDIYTIRLTVFDTGGNQVFVETTVQVDEKLKVGVFNITMTDLQVPMAGIPIVVNRTYDSRDKRRGDFGVGWRLNIQTLRIRSNRVLGSEWYVFRSGLAFGLQATAAHQVSITLADGRVETFDLKVSPEVSPIVPFPPTANQARLVATPGTLGTLESLGNNNLTILDGQPGPVFLLDDITNAPYNPDRFRYTDENGTQVVISKSGGVESVTDRNGNTLTFSANGITHSTGKSIDFVRDDLGRIIEVIDPEGNSQAYDYDGNGDLRVHTDTEDNSDRYQYDFNHGLLRIIDGLGNTIATNEFDGDGRLTATFDAEGNRVGFQHDLIARTSTITDPNGSQFFIEYDSHGNVVRSVDALGNETLATFDAAGNRASKTNPLGEVISFEFDGQNRETRRTNGEGHSSDYSYDASGRLTSVTDANGHVTQYISDSRGNRIEETDALGNVTRFSYDASGNMLSAVDARGFATQFEYDVSGNLITEIDNSGLVRSRTYDSNGRLLTTSVDVTQADGSIQPLAQTNILDSLGSVLHSSDNFGNTSSASYDANGQVLITSNVLGQTSSFIYNANGQLSQGTFADGTSYSHTYNVNGRVAETTGQDGRATSIAYNSIGQTTAMVEENDPLDPNDDASRELAFDAAGRLTQLDGPTGGQRGYRFDDSGRVVGGTGGGVELHTSQLDPNGEVVSVADINGGITTVTRDALDRPTQTEFPGGNVINNVYDANGNLTSTSEVGGDSVAFEYDEMNRLTGVEYGVATSGYQYDSLGRLTTVTDGLGRETRFGYFLGLTNEVVVTRPLGQQIVVSVDLLGNITRVTNPDGSYVAYEYNEMNRLVLKTPSDGVAVAYQYTIDGKLSVATDQSGDTRFFYNTQGQLESQINPSGFELKYDYDLAGNITGITSLSGTTTYAYGSGGRVSSIMDSAGDITTYSYDSLGNMLEKILPNGTRELRVFDASNQVIQVQFVAADDSVLRQFNYTVGSGGRYSQVTEMNGRTVSYGYDTNGRLSSELIQVPAQPDHTITYTYDAVGNRISSTDSEVGVTTFSYNQNDQLLTRTVVGEQTVYAYDANGSLVSESSTTRQVTYEWSVERRLLGVVITENGVNTVASYEYDFAGNRIAEEADGQRVRFLVDSNRSYAQVLEEVSDVGVVTASYVYDDELLSQFSGGNNHFYLTDGHSGVRVIQDAAEQIISEYSYDAFGRKLSATEGIANPYQYRSERMDGAAGQYYLRARVYDQNTGRFLTTDPQPGKLDTPLTQHRYLYANANPILYFDPSGAYTVAEVTVALGIVGVVAAISQQVMGVYKAGFTRDVTWEGPNIFLSGDINGGVGKFGGDEGIFGVGFDLGVTFQKAERHQRKTDAVHLLLTSHVSASLDADPFTPGQVVPTPPGNIASKAFKAIFGMIPSQAFKNLFSINFGDATIASQAALGGANGTEPIALNWTYAQFAAGVTLPAIFTRYFGTASAGVSMVLQGYAIGTGIPDFGTSISGRAQGASIGADIKGGVSINLTPDDKVNQPNK